MTLVPSEIDPMLLVEKATKREDGEDFPAEAFAYVPDPESPSTWKLRLWDSLGDKETARQIGMAVAALGPGFRGNKVEIPEGDLARVKARVLAAWRKTHPDAERGDEPDVLKGYGMEYKEDDSDIDPMDELLDAYQAFVRMGNAEMADEVMGLVHELQTVMMGDESSDYMKGHGMGEYNPVACLSQAHLGLLTMGLTELAGKVLALVGRASSVVYSPKEMNDDEEMAPNTMPVDAGYGMRPRRVRREIVDENGQYCVYSETGRKFGCYQSRDKAVERLRQLEQFAERTVTPASKSQLVEWHDSAHTVHPVTEMVKDVHDLICDELEVVHELAAPYLFDNDEKLAMLDNLEQGMISKANEYRYTLGPAYVPDREDAHGEFTDSKTLQKALWDWVRKGDRTIYLQHSDKAAGEMVEMLTWPFPIEADLNVPNQGVTKYTFPADTPFLGVIWEPWAWNLVKSGQLRGYSIGGAAKRVEAELPDEETMFAKGDQSGHRFRGNQHDPGANGQTLDKSSGMEGTEVRVITAGIYKGQRGVVESSNADGTLHKVRLRSGVVMTFRGSGLEPVDIQKAGQPRDRIGRWASGGGGGGGSSSEGGGGGGSAQDPSGAGAKAADSADSAVSDYKENIRDYSRKGEFERNEMKEFKADIDDAGNYARSGDYGAARDSYSSAISRLNSTPMTGLINRLDDARRMLPN